MTVERQYRKKREDEKGGFFWWPWSIKFRMECKYTTVTKGGKTTYLISLERFSLSVIVEMPNTEEENFHSGHHVKTNMRGALLKNNKRLAHQLMLSTDILTNKNQLKRKSNHIKSSPRTYRQKNNRKMDFDSTFFF